ncbi:hypothetical protein [Cryobacterium aureum]|uniref:hypothetical protein n=1 Tax=Cryobacterium aureum TaxID=995037 RepID=UPI00101AD405|nr:hypothetical protein [Cryobacterium aureum]
MDGIITDQGIVDMYAADWIWFFEEPVNQSYEDIVQHREWNRKRREFAQKNVSVAALVGLVCNGNARIAYEAETILRGRGSPIPLETIRAMYYSAMAENRSTPDKILSWLADVGSGPQLLQTIADHRACSAGTLATLWRKYGEITNTDDGNQLVQRIAANPACSAELLADLYRKHGEQDFVLARTISDHPSAPVQLVWTILTDHGALTAGSRIVAEKSAFSLVDFSRALDAGINLHSLLVRRDVPLTLLEAAALDESEYMRAAVAASPSTPENILRILAADHSEDVRSAVALSAKSRGMAINAWFASDPASPLQAGLEAEAADAPELGDSVSELPTDAWHYWMFDLAVDEDCTSDLLDRIWEAAQSTESVEQQKEPEERTLVAAARRLASNKNSSSDLLLQIMSTDDERAQLLVMLNPNAPTEYLWEMDEWMDYPETVQAVFLSKVHIDVDSDEGSRGFVEHMLDVLEWRDASLPANWFDQGWDSPSWLPAEARSSFSEVTDRFRTCLTELALNPSLRDTDQERIRTHPDLVATIANRIRSDLDKVWGTFTSPVIRRELLKNPRISEQRLAAVRQELESENT